MNAICFTGGTIVDGTGAPAYPADLIVQADRIHAIIDANDPSNNAELYRDCEMIDCQGLVIAPGFIDVHTHDDALVLQQPELLPKLSQGITTVIVGNCGISLVPLATPNPQPPLNLLGKHSFQYPSVAAYKAAFESQQPSLNVAVLIGHTTLRFAALSDLNRPASAAEIQQMCNLLEQALREGAIGLSTGLFYEPAFAAPAAEVNALLAVVAQHQGVYTSHLRSEMAEIIESIHEACDCAQHAQVPLVISHHKCAGPAQWGRTTETLALIEQYAQRQNINMDAYPYTAGSTVLREDLVDGVIDILITWSDRHPEMEGRSLADIADEWGISQQAACRRLQPGGACYFQMRQDDVDRVLTHPLTMIGSDGLPHDRHPHPRLWGAFPKVLREYYREKQSLSLEQAVHKMTGLSAQNFKLAKRGHIKPSWFADLVLFDPNTIQDTATFQQPIQAATGIHAVYVNGKLSYTPQHSQKTVRAGRLLLKSGLTE